MSCGGKREGAGRKKTGFCKDAPHRRRPELDARHPVHVVLRMQRRIGLRDLDIHKVVDRVLRKYLGRDDFRIVHLSIQNTHLHMIVEAANRAALTWGMQSFGIRFARAYQRDFGGLGKVLKYRYFSRQITTKRYARHALAYVLNNWRRHRMDYENGRELPWKLDPYSSAPSFTGWTRRFVVPEGYKPFPSYVPLSVSQPQTALLRFDWEKYGRISPYECPGPLL